MNYTRKSIKLSIGQNKIIKTANNNKKYRTKSFDQKKQVKQCILPNDQMSKNKNQAKKTQKRLKLYTFNSNVNNNSPLQKQSVSKIQQKPFQSSFLSFQNNQFSGAKQLQRQKTDRAQLILDEYSEIRIQDDVLDKQNNIEFANLGQLLNDNFSEIKQQNYQKYANIFPEPRLSFHALSQKTNKTFSNFQNIKYEQSSVIMRKKQLLEFTHNFATEKIQLQEEIQLLKNTIRHLQYQFEQGMQQKQNIEYYLQQELHKNKNNRRKIQELQETIKQLREQIQRQDNEYSQEMQICKQFSEYSSVNRISEYKYLDHDTLTQNNICSNTILLDNRALKCQAQQLANQNKSLRANLEKWTQYCPQTEYYLRQRIRQLQKIAMQQTICKQATQRSLQLSSQMIYDLRNQIGYIRSNYFSEKQVKHLIFKMTAPVLQAQDLKQNTAFKIIEEFQVITRAMLIPDTRLL